MNLRLYCGFVWFLLLLCFVCLFVCFILVFDRPILPSLSSCICFSASPFSTEPNSDSLKRSLINLPLFLLGIYLTNLVHSHLLSS